MRSDHFSEIRLNTFCARLVVRRRSQWPCRRTRLKEFRHPVEYRHVIDRGVDSVASRRLPDSGMLEATQLFGRVSPKALLRFGDALALC